MSSWSSQWIDLFSLYLLLDLFDTFHNLNSITSIGIFSRFHKPGISLLSLESILKLLSFLLLLLLLNSFISSFILLSETHPLLIIYFCYMEGHRDKFKGIDSLCLIVTFEVHKEGFFIWEIPVISDVIVHLEVVWPILVHFNFVSWQFCIYFTILLYYF